MSGAVTYDEGREAPSRTLKYLVVLKLDECQEDFGIGDCEAVGTRCFKSFLTCKFKAAYNPAIKDWRYATHGLPFYGYRQYVQSVSISPTQIKTNKTVASRAVVKFNNVEDTDVGVDPYLDFRDATAQSALRPHFSKMLARHYYTDRFGEIYEGYDDSPFDQYKLRYVGKISNVDGYDTVSFELVDLVRSLDDITIAPEIESVLSASIDDTVTNIPVKEVDQLPVPTGGETLYIRCEAEYIGYTSVNLTLSRLEGGPRGAHGTTAVAHDTEEDVKIARHYSGNPFDIIKDQMLLRDAEYEAAWVDSASYTQAKAEPEQDIDYETVIDDPTKLQKLYFEIADLADSKSWENEDGAMTIKRNLPNEPYRTYRLINDEDFTELLTPDQNDESIFTRTICLWNKDLLGDFDDLDSYDRAIVSPDVDVESAFGLGKEVPYKFFCRWIRRGMDQDEALENYIKNFVTRRTWRTKSKARLFTGELEQKHLDIRSGEYVWFSTSRFLNADGMPYVNEVFQVIERAWSQGRLKVVLMEATRERVAYIAPDDTPDWDSASAEEQNWWGFIFSDDLLSPEEGRHNVIW